MTAPNPPHLGPLPAGRRGESNECGTVAHPLTRDGKPLQADLPAVSLYVSAAGFEPVRIRTVRHRLHRPASHIMKPVASAEAVFTYTDFLHLAPAPTAVLPLADLSATLDPAISLVGQQHA